MNNKGVDQTVLMCRLICTFVVHIRHKQVFSWRGSCLKRKKKLSFTCFTLFMTNVDGLQFWKSIIKSVFFLGANSSSFIFHRILLVKSSLFRLASSWPRDSDKHCVTASALRLIWVAEHSVQADSLGSIAEALPKFVSRLSFKNSLPKHSQNNCRDNPKFAFCTLPLGLQNT